LIRFHALGSTRAEEGCHCRTAENTAREDRPINLFHLSSPNLSQQKIQKELALC
jgi:hypothetical protein